MITNPALASAVLRRPEHVLNNDPGKWALSVSVFGCRPGRYVDYLAIAPSLFAAVAKNLMQEPGVRSNTARTTATLARLVPALVPTQKSSKQIEGEGEVERRPWLRDAALTIVTASTEMGEHGGAVEVDLYTLVRDFTTHVSIGILAGADFLHTNPTFVRDLFALDNGFALLALGLPTWLPIRVLRKAVAAQMRILAALDGFQRRIDAVALGTADDATRRRVEDINGVFWDRNQVYRDRPLALEDRPGYELALFWAMNANTSPFVFWVLAHIYAHPDVLQSIRAEVDQHVQKLPDEKSPEAGDEDGTNGQLLDFDITALLQRCPHLRAAYLESFRLASQPSSLRHLDQHVTLNLQNAVASATSATDNARLTIPSDTYLTVPFMVAQLDAGTYPDPLVFHPGRFLVQEDVKVEHLEEGNGKAADGAAKTRPKEWKTRPSTLKPWGEGPGICKGRVFAEREVLLLVALVIATWDMEPLEWAKDGGWKFPGKVPGTGVCKPDGPMRVRMRRRQRP